MNDASDWMPLVPTDADLAFWEEHFVPPLVLWYWDDSPLPKSDHVQVIPRSELRTDLRTSPVVMANAFLLWAVPRSVTRIVIDDGSWRDHLSTEELSLVRRKQIEFGRGLCFPAEWLPDQVGEAEDGRLVLDKRLWHRLTSQDRRSIIQRQLIDWDEPVTLPIPENCPPAVRDIANRFLQREGVNCYAIATYGVTSDPRLLETWLLPDAFLHLLESNGYGPVVADEPIAEDVVTFVGESGPVHAAYPLATNRFLNKSGQSMFNPVRIVDWPTLLHEWPDLAVQIYRRG